MLFPRAKEIHPIAKQVPYDIMHFMISCLMQLDILAKEVWEVARQVS